jgi:hypothetical protein
VLHLGGTMRLVPSNSGACINKSAHVSPQLDPRQSAHGRTRAMRREDNETTVNNNSTCLSMFVEKPISLHMVWHSYAQTPGSQGETRCRRPAMDKPLGSRRHILGFHGNNPGCHSLRTQRLANGINIQQPPRQPMTLFYRPFRGLLLRAGAALSFMVRGGPTNTSHIWTQAKNG